MKLVSEATVGDDPYRATITTADSEGHLAEVKVMDITGGALMVVLGGDVTIQPNDAATGTTTIFVWPQGTREREAAAKKGGKA